MAKYLRKDCENGYITDVAEVNYFRKVQEFDIINNILIGDYNSKGEYVTTKEILEELLSMPKYITKTFNSTVFLQSYAELNNLNQLTFMITVEDGVPKANYSRATLFLTEDVIKAGGILVNTNSVVLDVFEAANDGFFNSKMFEKFKVESNKPTSKTSIPLNILNRKTNLIEAKKKLFVALKPIEKECLDKKLKSYNGNPTGAKIISEYENELKGTKFNEVQKEFFCNQILDMILERADYKKDKLFKKIVDENMQFYVNKVDNVKI